MVLEGVCRIGIAVYLLALTLGLGAIISVLRFRGGPDSPVSFEGSTDLKQTGVPADNTKGRRTAAVRGLGGRRSP